MYSIYLPVPIHLNVPYTPTVMLRLTMSPYSCGLLCGLCCCGRTNSLDALNYYQEQEEQLRIKVEEEQTNLHKKSIGVVFVTFSSLEVATIVKKDHTQFGCGRLVSLLSLSMYTMYTHEYVHGRIQEFVLEGSVGGGLHFFSMVRLSTCWGP